MKYARTALITGITGQDGSYLAEFLLSKGYEVHGIVRRSSLINTHRIDPIYNKIKLHYGDMTDSGSIIHIIQKVQPHEIYNLAAQSHVKVSFELPEYTGMVDAMGTLRILEAVRILGMQDDVRIYQASTSELYGLAQEHPQTETTPFHPRSPYGVAKLYGFWIIKNYREAYNMHCSSGILFNHESPLRGLEFVTRKITDGIAQILTNKQSHITLGNLDAYRDWGFAGDYVKAMYLIMNSKSPEDYVVASGKTYSIREFIKKVCMVMNIKIEFKGKGIKEVCIDKNTQKKIITIDKKYFRINELYRLKGNPQKIKNRLKWRSEERRVGEECRSRWSPYH